MCSGKSSVAASLARRLDWRFLDFDVEIERREGRPVAAIIDAQGEEYFRSLEAALTEEVARVPGIVLTASTCTKSPKRTIPLWCPRTSEESLLI